MRQTSLLPADQVPKALVGANGLTPTEWMRWSVSIWGDLVKTREEREFGHPASFPVSLAERVIRCWPPSEGSVVLDPFTGSGTTLVAVQRLGHESVGVELYERWARVAQDRLLDHPKVTVIVGDALELANLFRRHGVGRVGLTFTSPPYWTILTRKRTADGRERRAYGDDERDLGLVGDYEAFLDRLATVFAAVRQVTVPGGYLVVDVMDVRVRGRLFRLHADLADALERLGWIVDDFIIWDRRADYNNLKPLGYPYRFVINRVHEYLVVCRRASSARLQQS